MDQPWELTRHSYIGQAATCPPTAGMRRRMRAKATKHRLCVIEAVRCGQSVPEIVLQDYNKEPWAREALEAQGLELWK